MRRLIPATIAAALVGAVAASAVFLVAERAGGHSTPKASSGSVAAGSSSTGIREETSTTTTTPTATQIYERDASGVVTIKATTAADEDLGTGIVLNDEGLILTNDHVIAQATAIAVSPGQSQSTSRSATLVGTDASADLALIKVDPSGLGLKPLRLVSSSSVRVGDPVYAIGNPYGLDETLTKGIVSALGREIEAPDGASIAGAIQTDAALNPGNSGGPLLDAEGEVIGVNSQIASDAASVDGSQPGSTGVGFAISSNTAVEVIKKLEAGGGESSTRSAEGERQLRRSSEAEESSPYATESPTEAESQYGRVQRESEPYGHGAGGEIETGSGGEAAGREGRVVILP